MCFRVFTCSKTSPHPHLYRSSWIKSEQGPVPSRTSIDGFKGKSTGNHDLSPIFRGFLDHLPIIQFCALKVQLFFPVLPLGQANLCSSSPDLSMSEKVATRPAGSVYAAAYCACPGCKRVGYEWKKKPYSGFVEIGYPQIGLPSFSPSTLSFWRFFQFWTRQYCFHQKNVGTARSISDPTSAVLSKGSAFCLWRSWRKLGLSSTGNK